MATRVSGILWLNGEESWRKRHLIFSESSPFWFVLGPMTRVTLEDGKMLASILSGFLVVCTHHYHSSSSSSSSSLSI